MQPTASTIDIEILAASTNNTEIPDFFLFEKMLRTYIEKIKVFRFYLSMEGVFRV